MNPIRQIAQFVREDSAAVTVDWAVLTATVVGLGIAVLTSISGQITSVGNDIGDELSGDVTAQGAQTDADN